MITREQVQAMKPETRKAYVAMCKSNLVQQREQVSSWAASLKDAEGRLENARGALVNAKAALADAEQMVATVEGIEQ